VICSCHKKTTNKPKKTKKTKKTTKKRYAPFKQYIGVKVKVFIATFNNMSTISVLSEEETRVTGENHRPAASH
jgi:hypothetical protein